jgi:hypothetical protein
MAKAERHAIAALTGFLFANAWLDPAGCRAQDLGPPLNQMPRSRLDE